MTENRMFWILAELALLLLFLIQIFVETSLRVFLATGFLLIFASLRNVELVLRLKNK